MGLGEPDLVSIWTVGGRLKLPFVCGPRQRKMLASQQGETDLVLAAGQFYLLAVCNVQEPPLLDPDGVLGVDLGIMELATDSEGRSYSGFLSLQCGFQANADRNAACNLEARGRNVSVPKVAPTIG